MNFYQKPEFYPSSDKEGAGEEEAEEIYNLAERSEREMMHAAEWNMNELPDTAEFYRRVDERMVPVEKMDYMKS